MSGKQVCSGVQVFMCEQFTTRVPMFFGSGSSDSSNVLK